MLPKSPHNRRLVAASKKFKLHYFPEIPVSENRSTTNEDSDDQQKFSKSFQIEGQSGDLSEADRQTLLEEAELRRRSDEKEQVYQTGFTQGHAQGRQEEQERMRPALQSIQSACEALAQLQESLCQQAESAAVQLALAIARKVIAREVAMTPETVVSVAKAALAKVMDSGHVKVIVHPDDIPIIDQQNGDLKGQLDAKCQLYFEGDASIERGGCIVETDFGDIDARLDHQLDRIVGALMHELPKESVKPEGRQ